MCNISKINGECSFAGKLEFSGEKGMCVNISGFFVDFLKISFEVMEKDMFVIRLKLRCWKSCDGGRCVGVSVSGFALVI